LGALCILRRGISSDINTPRLAQKKVHPML
jgi:hypothetical protein